jgi:hypothetical protein
LRDAVGEVDRAFQPIVEPKPHPAITLDLDLCDSVEHILTSGSIVFGATGNWHRFQLSSSSC